MVSKQERALLQRRSLAFDAEVLVWSAVSSSELHGVVLGARSGMLNGRALDCKGKDFEFSLENGVFKILDRIYAPVPMPVIRADASGSSKVVIEGGGDGIQIRYTTDGADPLPTSAIYEKPIAKTERNAVRARAFRINPDGTMRKTRWIDSSPVAVGPE